MSQIGINRLNGVAKGELLIEDDYSYPLNPSIAKLSIKNSKGDISSLTYDKIVAITDKLEEIGEGADDSLTAIRNDIDTVETVADKAEHDATLALGKTAGLGIKEVSTSKAKTVAELVTDFNALVIALQEAKVIK
jgi:hypothetical protein